MKPKYNTSKFRNQTLGATLVTAISICIGGSAFATDWVGDVSTDWNNDLNWSGDAGTGGTQANINIASPVATISANFVATPVDIVVGDGAGISGRLDHVSGTGQTGNGNWMKIGRNGGTGVYNLADTSGVGGTLTGLAQGSGTMNVKGRLYIGGESGSGSTGTMNVHTTGNLAMDSEFNIGTNASTGVVNVDSGTITNNNWLRVGAGNGSSGTLNVSGGSVTKNGNDHMILGDNSGSTGLVNLNAGTITVNGECWIGQNAGKGTLNINGGTLSNNNWAALGRANAASEGTVNHTAGSWTKSGNGNFLIGDIGKGTYNLSGTGALTANNQLQVGAGGTGVGNLNMTGGTVSAGELFVGQGGGNGTVTMSGGTITSSNWTVIGRENGTGTVNMTGGTWNKVGSNQVIIGSSGPGTMNLSGGLVDVQGGYTWVGENGGATTATLTISGTGEWRTSTMSIGQNTPNAILNLNGGTLRTQRFIGARDQNDTGTSAGTGTVNFNGTQVIATANNTANFISTTVDNAVIAAGGLLVDSNGFNLVAPKALTGTGSVVKTGLGSLALNGANTYGGTNTVNAGKLALGTSSTGTGDITVANDAALGVNQINATHTLQSVNVTFGTSDVPSLLPTSLDIDLGNTAGNPGVAALNVTGTLTLNRQVVVNVADQLPAVGTFPIVTYAGGAKAGVGSFVLGSLPEGVAATLSDNGTGVVSLIVTEANQLVWDGTNESGLTKVGNVAEFSSDVTVADSTGIVEGQFVRGTGIPANTTVVSITPTTPPEAIIGLSNSATATATGVNLLFVTTPGTNEGVWDFVTENWVNRITSTSSLYDEDPKSPAVFDDTATGPTAVVLNTTVAPSSVLFNNSSLAYSLTGTGNISGTTGLTKSGAAALALDTTNDYTGVTRLAGGITTVDTLTNGGLASPLGAATAAPEKLVLAGGTLDYTGGAVSIDRGLSLSGASDTVMSELKLAADVTITGQITSPLGKLTKSGPGTLILSGTAANGLGNGNAGDAIPQSLRLAEGGLLFNGVGQTNTVTGRTAFGTTASATTTAEFANNVTFTGGGRTFVAFADSSTSTLTVGDTSQLQLNGAFLVSQGPNSVGTVIIEDSGKITKTGEHFSLGIGAGSTSTMTIRDTGSFTSNNDFNVGDVNGAVATLHVEENATVTSTGGVFVGKNNTTGTLNMSGDSNVTSGNTNVGGGTGSSGDLNISGTSNYISNGRLQVGPGGGSDGDVVISGSGSMQVNSYASVGFGGNGSMLIQDSGSFSNTDDFSVNESGDAAAVVTVQDNATMSVARTIFIGRNDNRVGTLNVTGAATVSQNDAAYAFHVGMFGTGTLNIQGTSAVNVSSTNGVVIGGVNTGPDPDVLGVGIINLDGGTLTTKRISDAGGTSTLNLNGGVLKAGAGADVNFMAGLNTVNVNVGGAFIDSNGQTIAIAQPLADLGGNLTKQGAGTLQLNGTNSYLGTTTVAAGTLGGTGLVGGELIVPVGSSVAPGAGGVGTFSVDDTLGLGSTIGGTYVCEISGANADRLAVAGALTISPGAVLDFNELSAPAAAVFIIASYGTLSGTFTVQDQPAGYTLDYNYLGGNQIALVQTATPYSTWASSFGLDPFTDGAPGFDKDGDGQTNAVEFALGGSPISGSNNAKTFSLVADGSLDLDSTNEMLLTIAVRTGTPAFIGSPSPTATQEGFTYTVEGSTSLGGFSTIVTPVAVVAPPAPNDTPPAGYEYRTFSLDGSNGLTNKGFLRVKVSN